MGFASFDIKHITSNTSFISSSAKHSLVFRKVMVQTLGTNFLPCHLSPERPASKWNGNPYFGLWPPVPFLSDWLLMKHGKATYILPHSKIPCGTHTLKYKLSSDKALLSMNFRWFDFL
jgi:hypothetical protein